MTDIKHYAALAQGAALSTIAIAAGTATMTINVGAGLKIGLLAAVIYGCADLTRIAMPVIASASQWTAHYRSAFAAAIAVSLIAIVTHLAGDQLQFAATKAAQDETFKASHASLERARAELASIKEIGTAKGLRSAEKQKTDLANREALAGGCRGKCLTAQAEASELSQRAAVAERREELEKKVAEMENATKDGEVVTSGLSHLVAALSGMSKASSAQIEAAIQSLAFIVFMEIAVYLIIPGSRLILEGASGLREARASREEAEREAREAEREAEREAREAEEMAVFRRMGGTCFPSREAREAAASLYGKHGREAREAREAGTEAEILPPMGSTKERVFFQLIALALQSEDYMLTLSARDIARMCGVSPTSAANWMRDCEHFSKVATTGHKTVWKLTKVK